MVLETRRGMKLTYCKTKFCALSLLITKINILRCTVSETSKYSLFVAKIIHIYAVFQNRYSNAAADGTVHVQCFS